MMMWAIIYLVAGIVISPIFVLNFSEGDTFKLDTADDAVSSMVFHLLWPIVICVVLIVWGRKARKERFEKRVENIMGHYHLEDVKYHDRSLIVVVPEADLKFLLNGYRKKKIKLKPETVKVIREELMNRNAEKQLLG